MKRMRKLVAIVLALCCLMPALALPAAAEGDSGGVPAVAQMMDGLGLLPGAGPLDGARAAERATRLEAATAQLRLLGLEAEALAFEGDDGFADPGVPDSQKPLLAYLKANPLLGWEADGAGRFNPADEATEQQVYTAMLAALGYAPGTDYDPAQVIETARGLSLYVAPTAPGGFTVGDLANAMAAALRAELKGEQTTLAGALALRDAALAAPLAEAGLLAAPGGNLVANPDFEADGGWTYFDDSPIVYTADPVLRGQRALTLTSEKGGVKSGLIAIEPGAAYSISAWVHGRVTVLAALYDQDGRWLSSYQNVMDGGRPGAWSKLDDYLQLSDDAVRYIDVTFTPVDSAVTIDAISLVPVAGTPLAKALWGTRTAAPAPKVGCYYFNNWVMADQWSHVKYFGEEAITPVLGYYRDASPEVQEWHIRQALDHGISFWVFDLYYDITTDTVLGNNAALDDGFLNAPSCGEMEFSVMWCNEEADFAGYTEAQLLQMVATMGERYFSRPNYLKSPDGRSIFAMTRPDRLIDQYGEAGTAELLRKMDAAAAEWGGLFFLTVKAPTVGNLAQLDAAGFDAATMYSYANEGMGSGKSEGPYDTILPTVEPWWRSASKNGDLPVVPTVSPNWDSRPLAGVGGRGSWRTGSTPEKFGQMCDALKTYVDPTLNMIMVGTWNEFGEGSYIEPTLEKGCDYLDAMQQSFFPEGYADHAVAAPTGEELARMVYADVPPLEPEIPADGNLVPNPGFESDYGWAVFDNSRIGYSTDIVHGGGQSMILTEAQGGVKTVGQFTARPGTAYEISVWVYGKARLRLALFTPTTWAGTYADIAEGGRQGVWTKLTGIYTAEYNSIPGFDVEIFYDDDGADIYIDDVCVRALDDADEDNILPNPGFEADDGWRTFLDAFTPSAPGEPVRGGARSFKLAKSHNGVKTTERFAYTASDRYDVRLWTYGSSLLALGVYDADGAFLDYQYTDITGGLQGVWTELTGSLTLADSIPGAAFFDVQIISGEAATENLVVNPDLEGAELMWYPFSGSLQWDTALFHSGGKSMKVSPANGGVKYWPNLAVEHGKSYAVSAWLYGEATIMAAQFDGSGNVIGYYTDIAHGGVAGEWTQLSAVFTIDNAAVKAINLEFRPGSSDVNVDDITLYEANDVFIDDVSMVPDAPRPPKAPRALAATATDTGITLSWATPPDGGSPLTHYTLTVWQGGEQTGETAALPADALTHTVTGLAPGTEYTLRLAAGNAVGEGPAAELVMATAAGPLAPESTGIEITALPKKVAYTVGKKLDLKGLEVSAVYSDGSRRPVSAYTTDPADKTRLQSAGTQTVTVTVADGEIEGTASFTVEVKEKGNPIRAVIQAVASVVKTIVNWFKGLFG